MFDVNRYALIAEHAVVNVILWDGNEATWHPEPGITVLALPDESPVGPGDLYDPDTGEFTRPN